MRVTIVGTGYVGLVTAVCLAEIGHHVICLDIDQNKINLLKSGKSTIYEPEIEYYMQKNKDNLKYTTQIEEAYKMPEIIIICVGTPQGENGKPNMQSIKNVINQIEKNLKNDCIIALKSTVPVGTTKKVEDYLKSKIDTNIKIEVISNPEFLSQGTAINDTIRAKRIILGVNSKYAENVMKKLYNKYNQRYLVTNRESAEIIKYASNTFLALKISYINEIANLCEDYDADIDDVSKGIGLDDRIGEKYLKAGIGYGGSCLPKDTEALNWIFSQSNNNSKLIEAVRSTNNNQKFKLLEKARKYYKDFNGIKVAILGVTFKPNTDDLRESPAVENIKLLLKEGAKISVFDPIGLNNLRKLKLTLNYCENIQDTIKDADICLIFTEWNEIKKFEPENFEKEMKFPIIIDGRNCYDIKNMSECNVIYESIGRKTIKNHICNN